MSDSSVSSSQAAGIEYVDWPVLGNEEPLPDDPMIALDKLTQASHKLAEAMYSAASPGAGQPPQYRDLDGHVKSAQPAAPR